MSSDEDWHSPNGGDRAHSPHEGGSQGMAGASPSMQDHRLSGSSVTPLTNELGDWPTDTSFSSESAAWRQKNGSLQDENETLKAENRRLQDQV